MKIPVEIEKRVLGPKEKIIGIQEKMETIPGVMHGDCFPLKHQFGDGLYVREIFMPKGALIVSKIHKYAHPYFVMQGKCSVLTDDGILQIQAPFYDITKAGTKRVLYIHEDCVWITTHSNPTNTHDLKEIENEIIAKDFKDVNIIDVEVEKEKFAEFVTEATKAYENSLS